MNPRSILRRAAARNIPVKRKFTGIDEYKDKRTTNGPMAIKGQPIIREDEEFLDGITGSIG